MYSNKVPTYKYKVSTKACDCSAKGVGDIDFGSASLLIKIKFHPSGTRRGSFKADNWVNKGKCPFHFRFIFTI